MIVFASLVVFSGCGKFLNKQSDESEEKTILRLDSKKGSCFTQTRGWMHKYFNQTASEEEVQQFWQCLGKGVRIFYRHAEGSRKERYSSQEIIYLLEKYVTKTPVSVETLSYILEVKALLLGGDEKSLTHQELKRFVSVFDELVKMSLALRPYMDIFSFKEKWPNYNEEQEHRLQVGLKEFNHVQRRIGKLLENNNKEYQISRFPHFLKSLESLVQPKKKWMFASQVGTYLSLVGESKDAFIGGPVDKVLPHQWPGFVELFSFSFSQYLRVDIIRQQDKSIWHAQSWSSFRGITDDLSHFFSYISQKYDKEAISTNKITRILNEMHVLWPDKVQINYDLEPLMAVKSFLIGGSRTSLRSEEFLQIPYWAEGLHQIQKISEPYHKVYLLKWDPRKIGESEKLFFERSLLSLEAASSKITSYLRKSKGVYELKSLIGLMELIENQDGKATKSPSFLKDIYKVLLKYKKTFIGGDAHIIKVSEWKSLISLTQGLWREYVRGEYSQRYRKLSSPNEKIESFQRIAGILKDAISRQGITEISVDELSILINMTLKLTHGRHIDRQLIRKTIELKRLFLGGSRQTINLKELNMFLLLSQYLKHHFSRLEKSIDYLFPKKVLAKKIAHKDWENFLDNIDLIVRDISFLIESTGTSISIKRIGHIVREWLKNNDDTDSVLDKIFQPDYLKNFRFIITGGRDFIIREGQWVKLLKRTSQMYLSYLSSLREHREVLNKEGPDGFTKHPESLKLMLRNLSRVLQKDKRTIGSREVAIFLKPFFNRDMSDEKSEVWVRSFKAMVIGGNRDKWTWEDFFYASKKLQTWTDVGKILANQSNIWALKQGIPKEEFSQFEKDISRAINIISSNFKAQKGRIRISDVSSFLQTIEEALEVSIPDMLKDERVLQNLFQMALARENSDLVSPHELEHILQSLSHIYVEFARWSIYKKHPDKSFAFNSLDYRLIFNALAKASELNGRGYFRWSEIVQATKDIHQYYPEDPLFPLEWSEEIPHVKTMFVGGRGDIWNSKDIRAVPEVINNAYQFYLKLQLHLPLFSLEHLPWAQVVNDLEGVLKIFEDWGSTFDEFNGVLHIRNFTTMAPQIGEEVFEETWSEIVELVDKYEPLITSVKGGLIGGDKDLVVSGEWAYFLKGLSATYIAYWQINIYLSKEELVTYPGLNHLKGFIEIWSKELRSVLSLKEGKSISLREMEDIMRGIYDSGVRFSEVSMETLSHVLNNVLQKIFGREANLGTTVVTDKTIVNMKSDIDQWLNVQGFINDIYREEGKKYSLLDLRENWEEYVSIWQVKSKENLITEDLKNLFEVINIDFSLAHNKKERLYFSRESSIYYTHKDLTQISWKNSLVRLVLSGYNQNSLEGSDLKGESLETIYGDFKKLAYEFGLFDPRIDGTWKFLALNADILTYHSNGDGLINHAEAVNLILMVLSGASHAKEIYQSLKDKCKSDRLDIYERPSLVFSCFSKEFYSSVISDFSDSPKLMKGLVSLFVKDSQSPLGWSLSKGRYRRGITEVSGGGFYNNNIDEDEGLVWDKDYINTVIEKVSFRNWIEEGDYEYAQLGTFLQILLSVEVIFQRFDGDRDGWLMKDEVLAAFPLFDKTLLKMSELDDVSMRRSLLTYIFSHKKIPRQDSFLNKLGFIGWHKLNSQEFRVDRRDVLKSFTKIINAVD